MSETVNHAEYRKYVLSPHCSLRGWKLLPYALQLLDRPHTEFFRKNEFALLMACDGRTGIRWDLLSEEEQKLMNRLEQNGYIRRCEQDSFLFPEQEYRFYPARFKESVQWSITGKCNFRCRHCFMSAPEGVQGEPTYEELLTMLDGFERCGIKGIGLTGGEPAIRRDFWQLVDEILKRGMVITTIFSNGMLITDSFLDELEKRNIYPNIQFSFDGIGWHDWMRGVPGAEKMAVDAMKRCQKRHIAVSVSMVLFRENIDTIRDTVNYLAGLGVQSVKLGNAMPQGEWANEKEHYLTQAEVNEKFIAYLPDFFADGRPLSLTLEGFFEYRRHDDHIGALFERDVREKYFSRAVMCMHVRREMYVSPKGRVLPCMSMVGTPIEEQFPSMLETPLEEILGLDSRYMYFTDLRISDYMKHNPECAECEYRELCCGGCRAWAVRDGSTDYLGRDPITCEYYKGGWKEKKDAVLRSLGVL